MRVRLESLGCRVNIGEMEEFARVLSRRGHGVVGPGEEPDVVVLNTCTVTHVASRKSRKLLRQLRRRHPAAKLVATGCYATLAPAQMSALGVDAVVANDDKDRLADALTKLGILADTSPVPAPDAAPFPRASRRTRAFIKVQDGCDNRCTFCIVTVARGTGRSRDPEDLIAEIRALASSGTQEVVLSGVHLGSYGQDLGRADGLRWLVQRVLDETPIPRVRMSSLEPWDLDEEFFAMWQDPRLMPHLHLPLQSGSDATLRRMARKTSRRRYAALLQAARAAVADLAVTSDVIVGFPGESDAEFEESLAFVREMDFARLHVFRYSERAGTAAAAMPGKVAAAVAAERSARMHELGEILHQRFQRSWLGRCTEVLWETSEPGPSGSRWSGLNGSYLRVVADAPAGANLANRVVPARVVATCPGAAIAKLSIPQPVALPMATACVP